MILDIFQSGMPSPSEVIIRLLALATIILIILPLHEWAHAFTAMKLGDISQKHRKRLTLNPLQSLDLVGSLCMLFLGFGWAKPVQIDPRYFKNPKVGMAISAAAGPISNIAAAIAGSLLLNFFVVLNINVFNNFTILGYGLMFFRFYIEVNIFLAIFNLIPIPPLDGSKILFGLLPDRIAYRAYQYEQFTYILLVIVIFTGIFDVPMHFLSSKIFEFILWLGNLPFSAILPYDFYAFVF